MLPVEIVPVQESVVLRARGSELLILPHHVRHLKSCEKPKDFSEYFRSEALVNRPARKLFEAWLRKDDSLWKRLYICIHKEMEIKAEEEGEAAPVKAKAKEAPKAKAEETPAKEAKKEEPKAKAEEKAAKETKKEVKAAKEEPKAKAKAKADEEKPAKKTAAKADDKAEKKTTKKVAKSDDEKPVAKKKTKTASAGAAKKKKG